MDNSYLIEGFGIGDAVEVALWVYTGGTAGAVKKITLKVGSKMLFATYLNWQMQIFTLMLDGYKYEEAVCKVKYEDAIWVGLTSIIDNHHLSGALNCVRATIKNVEKPDINFAEIGFDCIVELLKSGGMEYLISRPNSPYQISISRALNGKNRGKILKTLKNMGLTEKEAIDFLGMFPKEIINQTIK